MNEMKYSNVTWNKKGTLRTYSKSRPRYVNCKDPPNQDDVFGTAPLSDVVTKDDNKENVAFQIIKKDDKRKEIDRLVEFPLSVLTTVKDQVKEIQRSETGTCEDQMDDAEHPKNSTCIEGGARVQSPSFKSLLLSPIQANEQTNLNVIPMELTNPCTEKKNKSSNNYLSSIGGSSPYILAALTKRKAKKVRKFSVLPFIKQRMQARQEERLTLPNSANLLSNKVANVDRIQKKMEVGEANAKDVMVTTNAAREGGPVNEAVVPDSEPEVDDIDPELLDYSPLPMQISCSGVNIDDMVLAQNIERLNTKDSCGAFVSVPTCTVENNLKATPKGSDKEDRDITPEDKDNSLRLKKGPGSIKIRRSLYTAAPSKVPVDFLITIPANLNFNLPKKLQTQTSRKRNASSKESHFTDILLM
eukprot:Seg1803.1 transcript_id=Seg1803.1/GoldUCD/mRNA.D3Y31 product="hypothetical protein" protein_id=Seg1803.1/GoldUCD/D3Y31